MRELIDALFLFMGEIAAALQPLSSRPSSSPLFGRFFTASAKPVFARRRMFLVIRCVPNEGGTGLSLVSPRCC